MTSTQSSTRMGMIGNSEFVLNPTNVLYQGLIFKSIKGYSNNTLPKLSQKLYIPFVHSSAFPYIGFIIQNQYMLGTVTNIEFITNPNKKISAIINMGEWTANDTSLEFARRLAMYGEYRMIYDHLGHFFTLKEYKAPEVKVIGLYGINNYVHSYGVLEEFPYPDMTEPCQLPLSLYIPVVSPIIKERLQELLEDISSFGRVRRIDFVEKPDGNLSAFLHMKEWFIHDITEGCWLIFEERGEFRIVYTEAGDYLVLRKMTCDILPDSVSGMNSAQLEGVICEKDVYITELLEKEKDYEREIRQLRFELSLEQAKNNR